VPSETRQPGHLRGSNKEKKRLGRVVDYLRKKMEIKFAKKK
jgi:hypothetical protein